MGENTTIAWAHHTLNTWVGCAKVAPECENCYASDNRFVAIQRGKGRELWGPRGERHITAPSTFRKVYQWDRAAAKAGERRRVFCHSLSDILEDRRELGAPRGRLWAAVEQCTNLDFLLLSKRPENFATLTPHRWRYGAWPRNAWAGTSGGCQATVDELVPQLLWAASEAAVRFVSAEPLLSAVDFTGDTRGTPPPEDYNWLTGENYEADSDGAPCPRPDGPSLDLVIIGGESGQKARPCNVEWIRSIVGQCKAASVPCFVKQLGSRPVDEIVPNVFSAGRLKHPKGGDMAEFPEDLRVREFPK